MDPAVALAKLGGSARWADLLAMDVTEWALGRAREAGRVVMPVRGAYALPNTDPASVAATVLRGQVTCVSACSRLGLRRLNPPQEIHIAIPGNRHIRDSRLEALHLPGVHRGEAWHAGRRVLTLAQALDTAALCTTPLEQLVMVDAALERGYLDHSELKYFTCGSEARRAWLMRLADGAIMSVSESVAHATLVAAGLHPRVQVGRRDVGTLDFAVGTRHFIEVDGFDEHSKWDQFTKDRRRDRAVAATRDWTLRYTYWDVVEDPRWFAHDVARILRVPVQRRFEARIAWLTARPSTALNRI